MKKKHAKTPKKVEELIKFAEEMVGKECMVKEDSVLALKSCDNNEISRSGVENLGKTPMFVWDNVLADDTHRFEFYDT